MWRQLPVQLFNRGINATKDNLSPTSLVSLCLSPEKNKKFLSSQCLKSRDDMAAAVGDGAASAAGDSELESPARTKKDLYEARIEEFERVLSAEVIDLNALRKLALGGVPECRPGDVYSLRARTWKILLGHLSKDTKTWGESQRKRRRRYAEFCEEFMVDPTKVAAESDATDANGAASRNREGSLSTSQVDDDPLSTKSDSVWNKYFADNEVKDQIARDVDRTHPDIHFFNNQVGDDLLRHSLASCLRCSLSICLSLSLTFSLYCWCAHHIAGRIQRCPQGVHEAYPLCLRQAQPWTQVCAGNE